MKPTAEMEAKGMKAYEQVLAYERLRSWRLPVTLGVMPVLAVVTGVMLWRAGYTTLAWADFVTAIVVGWMARMQWKHLAARHANNVRLLAKLKAEFGDALPWVQVENHFAELERIKEEEAEEGKR